MKLAFIFGTRPEIIKLSSCIRACIRKKISFIVIHTGQHYSRNMSKLFLQELDLPEPDYELAIRSKAPYRQGDHTGRMMIKLENILLKEMPDVLLVQGDTNSALAGALTASKISTTSSFTGFNIKVAHVEAGLRSYDRTMPEEINRVIADHLADYLFAPTAKAKEILLSEAISKKKIWVTGNTIVDALFHGLELAEEKSNILKRHGLKKNGYMLLTMHRQENVDNKKRLKGVFRGIMKVCKKHKMPVVFPIHPRTSKKMDDFGIKMPDCIKAIAPCGFVDFVKLESAARIVLTDSGGVQEEVCVLKVPCVTLRDTTERPESVEVGGNVIAGLCAENIERMADKMMASKQKWRNPFGNGKSGEKIVEILRKTI